MGDEGAGNWELGTGNRGSTRSRCSRFPVPGSPFASSPCPGRSDLPVRDGKKAAERRAAVGIVLGLDSSAMRENDRTTDR